MTPADLAAIEERCSAATDGPWRHDGFQLVYCDELGDIANATSNDAAFIAHARSDVPALLAEVRRLQADNERLRRGMEALMRIDPYVGRDGEVTLPRYEVKRIADNLLAGREWDESTDGAEGESK